MNVIYRYSRPLDFKKRNLSIRVPNDVLDSRESIFNRNDIGSTN